MSVCVCVCVCVCVFILSTEGKVCVCYLNGALCKDRVQPGGAAASQVTKIVPGNRIPGKYQTQ